MHSISLNDYIALAVGILGFLTAWLSRKDRLPAWARRWLKRIGPDAMGDLLRYHAGEANNQIFTLWGSMQVVYGAAVVLVLLFFTNVGKWRMVLAASMLMLA
mgnify:CR=1 FL=1